MDDLWFHCFEFECECGFEKDETGWLDSFDSILIDSGTSASLPLHLARS